MSKEGLYLQDPETQETRFVYFDELDEDIFPQLWKPIGGFCYEAEAFARIALPAVPFYIKDWLPKHGKAVIYAPAKSGKSFFCLQIARSIGVGIEVLNLPTTQGRVLYAQFELGQAILQQRMRDTKQTYDNVYVGTTFAMKLDSDGGRRLLWTALEAIKPSVLILDPLYKTIQGDENAAVDMLKILDFLDSVIEGFDCSILIIHHTGKDVLRGGRGSSILEDWTDSYIEMRKLSKKGEPLKVRFTPKLLRHAELPPDSIEAELRDFEFVSVGLVLTVRQKVEGFFLLKAGQVVSPKEIFEARLGSRRAVYDALGSLIEEGRISKVGRGEYQQTA